MRAMVRGALVIAVVASVVAGAGTPAVAEPPNGVYVSTSGIPHTDVGDYRQSARWRRGMPKGRSRAWRQAISTVIGQIASEQPDAVFHTGDMVEGRWGTDLDGAGVFGPVDTFRRRTRAVRRAGDLYYSQMRDFWARSGLHPHFAFGDHEAGDIGRGGVVGTGRFKYRALSQWRRTWARHFTGGGHRYALHPARGQHRRTAYATVLGDVGLVTLDPIRKTDDGIRARIAGQQLRWMRAVVPQLRDRGARWIFVQCEVPAIGVDAAWRSSGLRLRNGDRVWRTLQDLDVDLLLSAELHDASATAPGRRAPVQIVHGGILRRAVANYLVIRTYDDRVEVDLKRMRGLVTGTKEIWAPSRHRAPQPIEMYPGAKRIGTLTIGRRGRLRRQSGRLRTRSGRLHAAARG